MDIYRSLEDYFGDADYRPIACDMCCQNIAGPFVVIDHGVYGVPFVCLPCMKKAVEQMEPVEIVDEAIELPQDADLMHRVVGFLQWVHNDAATRAAPFYAPYSEASILSAKQETWNMAQDAKKLISDIEKALTQKEKDGE